MRHNQKWRWAGLLALVLVVWGAVTAAAAEPQLRTGRYGAAAVAVADAVYVIGGSGPAGFLGTIERLDPRAGSVTAMETILPPRRYHTAEAVGGRIYITGGYGPGGRPDPRLEIYDPAADTVTLGPALPTPRYFASSAVIDDRIHVAGGSLVRGDSPVTGVVEIFDPATGSWESGPPLAVARQAELVACQGRLYAIGGYDGVRATRVVEALDPGATSWRRLADLPFPMSAHRALAAGGRIYTFGDYYEMDRVWVYAPESDAWDVVVTDYRPARHAAAAVVADTLVILGGNVSTSGTNLAGIQLFPLPKLAADSRTAGIGPWTPRPADRR